MPIKPENRNRYPKDWHLIRLFILERAGECCEWCGVPNGSINPATRAVVVLTIMHLNHTPEDCRPVNLKAACQKCHNSYDVEHRRQTRAATRNKEFDRNQGKLF